MRPTIDNIAPYGPILSMARVTVCVHGGRTLGEILENTPIPLFEQPLKLIAHGRIFERHTKNYLSLCIPFQMYYLLSLLLELVSGQFCNLHALPRILFCFCS